MNLFHLKFSIWKADTTLAAWKANTRGDIVRAETPFDAQVKLRESLGKGRSIEIFDIEYIGELDVP